MTQSYWTPIILGALLAAELTAQTNKTAPKPAPASDWPMYNRDLAGTRYSPLAQINTKNVAGLKQAWSFQLKKDASERGPQSEATPIVVKGVMYLPAGNRIVALEPETGKIVWEYVLAEGVPQRRGVTYWPGDGVNPARIFFTSGSKLVGLNAKTGTIDPGFGKEGTVDTVVAYNSAPTIYKNSLFIGANVPEQPAKGPPGDTRAYDARTGAKLWEFHSVPRAGEDGNETWPVDGWQERTGANNWGFSMTVDEERGLLYTTYGSPASDFYGGDRRGNDLYGNSVVALDANTGKVKWFFQAVHHDTWDFDLPPAPGLMDIVINGKKTPILAQTGKVGYLYILNRETGRPIFGIDEKPVPQSKVPGEFSSPTQPIPVKPPPFGRMSFKPEDIVTASDTTPEHAAACQSLMERSGGLYNEGPFTPWVYRAEGAPPVSSVIFPGAIGGTNWGGTASDPKLGYVFTFTNEYGSIGWIEKKPDGSSVPYDQASVEGNPFNSKFWARKNDASGRVMGAASWPCQKPPWGRLTAVNAKTGEFAWQVRLGVTNELPEASATPDASVSAGPS